MPQSFFSQGQNRVCDMASTNHSTCKLPRKMHGAQVPNKRQLIHQDTNNMLQITIDLLEMFGIFFHGSRKTCCSVVPVVQKLFFLLSPSSVYHFSKQAKLALSQFHFVLSFQNLFFGYHFQVYLSCLKYSSTFCSHVSNCAGLCLSNSGYKN